MLDHAHIHQLLHHYYGLVPLHVESLQTHPLKWRDLMQVTTATHTYLLRLLSLPDGYDAMQHTAQVLHWLQEHNYPAPRVRRTVASDFVLRYEDWTALLVSFISGNQIGPSKTSLYQLGAALGQLHRLDERVMDAIPLVRSRCHPAELAVTYEHFDRSASFIAPPLKEMLCELREAVQTLLDLPRELRMVHGDCWFANAVQTPDTSVVLIDWDCAGLGLPLLDLGYLLLTSHFDLVQPLEVRANQTLVAAILDGYSTSYVVPPINFVQLQSAIRFLPAYQLGQYLATHKHAVDGDPTLQKLQARFAATTAIAELAFDHLQLTTKG